MLYDKRHYSKTHNEFNMTAKFKSIVKEKIPHNYSATFSLKHVKLEY